MGIKNIKFSLPDERMKKYYLTQLGWFKAVFMPTFAKKSKCFYWGSFSRPMGLNPLTWTSAVRVWSSWRQALGQACRQEISHSEFLFTINVLMSQVKTLPNAQRKLTPSNKTGWMTYRRCEEVYDNLTLILPFWNNISMNTVGSIENIIYILMTSIIWVLNVGTICLCFRST